ncbi:hypothetical protein [Streptomyces niveus]|uniref:hypothetical protein n=1 Tax=Streptomyces niveus TaxID=193462 RepID=UPI0035D6ACA8
MSGGDNGGTTGPAGRPRAYTAVDGEGRLVVHMTLPLPASARPRLLDNDLAVEVAPTSGG